MNNTRMIKRATAVTLAMAMAFSLSPVIGSGAKVKKPSIQESSYGLLVDGDSVTVKIKKNGSTIRSTTWKSTDTQVFTVKKKSNTRAVISPVGEGKAKLKATVKTGTGKTFRLTSRVDVSINELVTFTSNWKKPETPVVDDNLKPVFDKAVAEFADEAAFTPIAWLGMNMMGTDMDYLVFAKRTPVIAGGKTTYVMISIHETLETAVVSDMIETDIEAYGTGNPDGWNETETPLIDKTAELVFQTAVSEVDGFSCTPLALLAMRTTNETNYCFITEFMPLADNATPAYNLMQINVNDAGEVKTSKIINLVSGRESTSDRAVSPDQEDLDKGKYYVCLYGEAVYRVFHQTIKRGLNYADEVLWDFTMEQEGQSPTLGYFKYVNEYEPYENWEAHTYCRGYWGEAEMTTLNQKEVTNYDVLNGKYDFKKDLDDIVVGWQMFDSKTTKVQLQKRINNTISDSVYNTIVKGLDPDNKNYSYYKFVIYGYDNTKKQTVGKFAGVMSYIRSTGRTVYFDAVGINPNDKTYYGKRITENVSWKSVNSNYD